jgi:gliding motility-associated-like protein
MITAREAVVANFEYSTPSESYYFYQLEETSNLETGVTYTFDWDIEGFTPRTGPTQEITFPSVDVFTVNMTVTDEFGCSSSVTKDITILEEISVPNVFTPGSGQNDFFIIESIAEVPIRIKIFSRTGILVYEKEGTVITWDGTTASGDVLNTGVYFYTLESLTGDPNKLYSKSGFFHMYRKK